MIRPRNPYRQIMLLFGISLAIFMLVGLVGSLLDPSTPEERACIVKQGQAFMECVREKWRGRN